MSLCLRLFHVVKPLFLNRSPPWCSSSSTDLWIGSGDVWNRVVNKQAHTRPLQAWCNIQGFIRTLHTVHQSDTYGQPSAEGLQVHCKVCKWKSDFSMKITKWETRFLFQSMLLHRTDDLEYKQRSKWQQRAISHETLSLSDLTSSDTAPNIG